MNSIITSIEAAASASTSIIPGTVASISGTSKSLSNVAKVGGIVGATAVAALVGVSTFKLIKAIRESGDVMEANLRTETSSIEAQTERAMADIAANTFAMRQTEEKLIKNTESMITDVKGMSAKVQAEKKAATSKPSTQHTSTSKPQHTSSTSSKSGASSISTPNVTKVVTDDFSTTMAMMMDQLVSKIIGSGHKFKDETPEETAERWVSKVVEASNEGNALYPISPSISPVEKRFVALHIVIDSFDSQVENDALDIRYEKAMSAMDKIMEDLNTVMDNISTDTEATTSNTDAGEIIETPLSEEAAQEIEDYATEPETPSEETTESTTIVTAETVATASSESKEEKETPKYDPKLAANFRRQITTTMMKVTDISSLSLDPETSIADIARVICNNMVALRFRMVKYPGNLGDLTERYLEQMELLRSKTLIDGHRIWMFGDSLVHKIPSEVEHYQTMLEEDVDEWEFPTTDGIEPTIGANELRAIFADTRNTMKATIKKMMEKASKA